MSPGRPRYRLKNNLHETKKSIARIMKSTALLLFTEKITIKISASRRHTQKNNNSRQGSIDEYQTNETYRARLYIFRPSCHSVTRYRLPRQ